MDATRLPAAVAAQPSAPAAAAPSVTVPDHPAPIAGRFVMQGSGAPTPTGVAGDAADLQGGGTVTLKLVPAEVLPTPTMADRALRELKQLAKVASDRIVRPVDQGRLPDGRIYVATERVDAARTLEEIVRDEGPLPLERAKAIVLQVGEALTEAQKVGVIHRDVAPRNVLVGPGDHVKLADFGLAEPVPGEGGGNGTVAKVFGTPAFLSPEQAEGKPVDQRSNIYSLGAMYYYALTGQTPFAGDAHSLLQQHLSATPAAPSTRRPGLPGDVDRVILKALEKSGGRRHLTLRQLLTEVAAHAAAAPAAQPVRADAQAKTMMAEAPRIAPTQPERPQVAQTMMGIPSPVAAPRTVPSQPAVTAPSMPAVPPHAAPQAPTVMAEAPRPQAHPAAPQAPTVMAEAPRPQPQAVPQPVPPAPTVPQAPTVMAEAPRPQPAPTVPQAPPQAPTVMAEAPRPATAAPAAAPTAKANNNTGKKGAFRETAWFKRGEIEEEMAKAQAAASASGDPLKSGTTGQHVPVDESQVALSATDHARLSLKTGSTQAMPVIKAPQLALPGERMNEEEMLAEIAPSRKYFLIAGAVVLAIVLGLVIYFATRPAPHAEAPPADKPAPVAAAPPAAAAPTAPATTTPATTTPAATTPAATAPTTPSPTTTKTAAAPHPATTAPAPSGLAGEVEKLEAARSVDKRELKRLEKAVGADLVRAHRKKEKAAEAADKQLLARLHKLAKRR